MTYANPTEVGPDTKSLKQWIDYVREEEGIIVRDPDGFDRFDPEMFDLHYTEEEFRKGLMHCTISGIGEQIRTRYSA
jgi:hypothetical protein